MISTRSIQYLGLVGRRQGGGRGEGRREGQRRCCDRQLPPPLSCSSAGVSLSDWIFDVLCPALPVFAAAFPSGYRTIRHPTHPTLTQKKKKKKEKKRRSHMHWYDTVSDMRAKYTLSTHYVTVHVTHWSFPPLLFPSEEGWHQWAWMDWFQAVGEACKAIFWPTPGLTERNLEILRIVCREDLNLRIRWTPRREHDQSEGIFGCKVFIELIRELSIRLWITKQW